MAEGNGSFSPNLIAIFAIRDSRRSDLNGTDAAVLFAIASRLDENGRCFPSYDCIAADAKIARSAAAESVDYLRRLGIILVLVGIDGRNANTYELNIRALFAPALDMPLPRRTRTPNQSAKRTIAESAHVRQADEPVRQADGIVRAADASNESAKRTQTSPPSGHEEDTEKDKNTINARSAVPSDPASPGPSTARSGPTVSPSSSSCSVVQVSLFGDKPSPLVEPKPTQTTEKRSRKKQGTALPEDLAPSPDNVRWAIGRAAEFGIEWDIAYVGLLTDQFKTRAQSEERRATRWIQAWQNWILIAIEREVKFRKNKPVQAQGSPAYRARETGSQSAGFGGDGWLEGIPEAERQQLATAAKKGNVRL